MLCKRCRVIVCVRAAKRGEGAKRFVDERRNSLSPFGAKHSNASALSEFLHVPLLSHPNQIRRERDPVEGSCC